MRDLTPPRLNPPEEGMTPSGCLTPPRKLPSSSATTGSPVNAPTSRDSDSRLDELEVKSAFMEDTLERLNDVVVRQQRQIDHLLLQLTQLRQLQASLPDAPGFTSLHDERPPHY